MGQHNHSTARFAVWILAAVLVGGVQAATINQQTPIAVQVYDQIAAKVNSDSISKRDVEERMNGVAERLIMFKKEKERLGQWDKERDEAEWNKMYIEHYLPALQSAIRDRLKLQYFKIEKMSIDEKEFQKEYTLVKEDLRKAGNNWFNPGDVEKRVKERMQLDEFSGKFNNATELPRRPEVERYYQENMERFKRKAAVKVRIIRIDQTVMDKLTGVKKVRDNPYSMLEEIRKDIVEFGGSFAETARKVTDDLDARESGGLIVSNTPDKDPYVIPDDMNPNVRAAIRDLKLNEVSPIFTYGATSYAIAMVEDRREAGYIPLEGQLYDRLYREVRQNKARRKEDEWFRATLAKSLILQVIEGTTKPLPISFFFPDDKKTDGTGTDVVSPKDGKKAPEKK